MKKKFVWEKWKDPLLSNIDEVEWAGFNIDDEGDEIPVAGIKKQPAIMTPFGILSVYPHIFSTDAFDFWLMHTNFDITDGIAGSMEKVPGVETMDVMTRYRVRFGFPRSGLFSVKRVITDIEAAVRHTDIEKYRRQLDDLPEENASKVLSAIEQANIRYDQWTIWVSPNGRLEIIGTTTATDYQKYMTCIKQIHQAHVMVGGRLIDSGGFCG